MFATEMSGHGFKGKSILSSQYYLVIILDQTLMDELGMGTQL